MTAAVAERSIHQFGDCPRGGAAFYEVMHASLHGAETLDGIDLHALWQEDPADAVAGRAVFGEPSEVLSEVLPGRKPSAVVVELHVGGEESVGALRIAPREERVEEALST